MLYGRLVYVYAWPVYVYGANPIVLRFEEDERGKRVYYAARWINNTSQSGPWSGIESAFVP
jgi:hypothetical protein